MIALPETPYWLIEYNHYEKAKKSLKFFRGFKYDVNEELEEIHQRHLSKDKSQSCLWLLSRLFSKTFFQPFLCCGVLFLIFTITGFDTIVFYMVTILKETGSSIDPKVGPMIVGSVRATLSCGGPFIIKIVPPKILFTIAQLISTCCVVVLGIFAYWKTYCDIEAELAWIPLSAIILIITTRQSEN